LVKVLKVRAHELIKVKAPPDTVRKLYEELTERWGLRPRSVFYVGPEWAGTVRLPSGETVAFKCRPSILAREYRRTVVPGREYMRAAVVTFLGPPQLREVAGEAYACLVRETTSSKP